VKNQIWSFVLRLILFLTGLYFCTSSVFDHQGAGSSKRILLLALGFIFLIAGVLISLPVIFNHPNRAAKLESISRYLVQAPLWCLLSLLVVELALRITVFNLPVYWNATNWAGDIPAPGSIMVWGREGFGITHYEKWGEIYTPHQDDQENDVLVLGDSQTEALQVMDDVKFVSLAETTLLQDGYDADLHNMGRSGLGLADHVSWIPAYINLYQPKVIVVQLTISDFVESFSEEQFNYFVAQDNTISELVHRYDFSTGFKQRNRNKYIWNGFVIQELGYERWNLMQQPDLPSLDTNTKKEAWNADLIARQMEMLIEACNGIPLVVILLPSAPYPSGAELETMDPAHTQLKELIQHYPEVNLVDPLPQFQQLASSGSLPRGFFNTTPGVGHLNQHGHEIVGQLLAETIEQILK
jgi:hypothetical protein